jgi:hypothetical protein
VKRKITNPVLEIEPQPFTPFWSMFIKCDMPKNFTKRNATPISKKVVQD